MSSSSNYWSRVIAHSLRCAPCGGAVRKKGAAPIAKGSVLATVCIRCGTTGGVRDKLGQDPSLNNVERI